MNFSFELEGAAMTGNISPDMMEAMAGTLGAFIGSMAIIWIIIWLAIMVFMIISRWRLFKKAGLPGRGILIPIYNIVLMLKLGGMSGRRALSLLFPPLLAVVMIINYFKIAKNFGKHWAFGLGIRFIKFVFIPILAFDDSKYLNKKTIAKPVAMPIAKPIAKPVTKTIAKPATKTAAKAPAKKAVKKVVKKAPAKKVVKKVKTLTKKK